MDLLQKKWLIRGEAQVKYENNKMIISNNSNYRSLLVYPYIFKKKEGQNLFASFYGEVKTGTACSLKMLNRHKTVLNVFNLNSESYIDCEGYKYFLMLLYVPENSVIELNKVNVQFSKEYEINYSKLNGDILVVTPGYPTLDNKYNCAFVHTRVCAYKKMDWNVDVLCVGPFNSITSYSFEGVDVSRSNYYYLRTLLQNKHYDKVLIHFFDNNVANVLESVDTSEMKLYFYLHGAETLYRDWPKIASPYFGPPAIINDELEKLFKIKDFYIEKYNKIDNAKWIFVTDWTKKRCEELLNIKFNNYDVIPCLIDTELFNFEKKAPELRKKIFVLRKFDDINSYSLDTVVRIILELSRREIFNDLEFDIYGQGSLHDIILEPICKFNNVHIHNTFLTHEEIKEVHRTHGIALFPTRFDSQAVSSCEAASSGCAVVTSDIPGVRQFIPEELGVMCQTENYKEYADVIEKMYNEPDYFLKVGELESKSVQSKFDYKHTIQKEITMYEHDDKKSIKKTIKVDSLPILSVIIPSYNVSQYLRHTVFSILDQRNASKVEVIIVNDGSKDNTAEIAFELEKKYSDGKKSLVRVIDKENGGHGSTINVGIRAARGKYVKVIDGDDTVDSENFALLLDILENEDSDIVLNNYIEDFAKDNLTNVQKIYGNLKPGIQYHFDDLCNENYGFTSWGPILSCSSYKTSMLLDGDVKLLEKTFYVDMELNINVAILCDTITYYDLDVYRYLLGRTGQSVSRDSYMRNYKHHENVCMKMIEIYYKSEDTISEQKKKYIKEKLIIPMLSTQYEICINYFNHGKPFREFDKRLKQYPEFYNNKRITIKKVKFHRIAGGRLIKLNKLFIMLNRFIRR